MGYATIPPWMSLVVAILLLCAGSVIGIGVAFGMDVYYAVRMHFALRGNATQPLDEGDYLTDEEIDRILDLPEYPYAVREEIGGKEGTGEQRDHSAD